MSPFLSLSSAQPASVKGLNTSGRLTRSAIDSIARPAARSAANRTGSDRGSVPLPHQMMPGWERSGPSPGGESAVGGLCHLPAIDLAASLT